jgi:AHBA synthesis associated protein
MPFKLVVFDLDGVLVDSTEVMKIALKRSYDHAVGQGEASFAEFKKYLGRSLPKIFEIMNLPQSMVEHYVKESYANSDMTRIYAGIQYTLNALKQMGVRTGIATGKSGERARWLLDQIGLGKYMDHVLGSDEVPAPKPDPSMLYQHMAHFDVTAKEMVFVGDAMADLLCSKAAGVPFAAAIWGSDIPLQLMEHSPEYCLSFPEEIIQIVGGLHEKTVAA